MVPTIGRERVDRVEIRLLGNLRIRAADGTVVGPTALRTRKTMDLLRLLALRVGEPVAVPLIVERLWPEVPERRGRASLRTAASTIRGVLGQDSLERRLDGLALSGAWVDTVAFSTLAAESRIYLREGRQAQAVLTAREAEALYLHDFRADDDSASWVVHERDQLRVVYGRLLEDAAEAALALGWYRDVDDFASRAITRDPYAERPVRALMTAYAATGQVERALRAFQRCRHALVDELGVDPSAQTDALRLSILRGEITGPAPRPVPMVGRDRELVELSELLRQGGHVRPHVIELRGPPGAGRHRLVDEARRQVGTQVLGVESATGFLRAAVDGRGGGDDEGTARHVVLVASPQDPDTSAVAARLGLAWHGIRLGPLSRDATASLVAEVLGSPAGARLVDHVLDATRGVPGDVVGAVRQMMRSGRLVSTSEGIAVVDGPGDRARLIDATAMVARALEVLTPGSDEVLPVLAVAPTPLALPALLEILSGCDPAAVHDVLDQLVDVSILVSTPEGYRFRHPLVASAVRAWLRPSVRHELRARVARRDLALPPAAAPRTQEGRAPDLPRQLVRTTGRRAPGPSDVAEQLAISATTPLEAADAALRAALDSAWAATGVEAGDRAAATSLLLAGRVLLPGRRLVALDQVLDGLPALTSRPDLLAGGEVLRWLPRILLGHAASAREAVEAAAAAAPTPSAEADRLRWLAALARNDLGCAGAPGLAASGPAAVPSGRWGRFLPFRVLAEHRDPVLPRQHRPGSGATGVRRCAASCTLCCGPTATRRPGRTTRRGGCCVRPRTTRSGPAAP